MPVSNIDKVLNKFGKRVVKESKTALTKKKKNASKELYNSIAYDLDIHKNSFHLSFKMAEHGKFIDKGVKGVGGVGWTKKVVTNNLYKYTTKRPPASAFNGWVIRRGIAPRDAKGKFMSRRSLMFAIANSVYHTGLETTNFFTKPLESAFKSLPDDLLEAYGLDIDDFLK